MCEHGCQAFHYERQDGRNIRSKQLRNREVPWEGSHRSKLMSRRTERPYKVDGAGELAPHSAARRLAPEINGPVVQQKSSRSYSGRPAARAIGNGGGGGQEWLPCGSRSQQRP